MAFAAVPVGTGADLAHAAAYGPGFFLFLVVNATLFVRPTEIVPALEGWEIYQALIVTPLLMFTRLFLGGIVDGLFIAGSTAGASASAKGLGALVRRVQSGNIRSYAGWLALGAAAVIAIMIFGHIHWLN